MSKDILRDYVKDTKKTEGGKYINNRDLSRGLRPSEYGGFLDKKRTRKKYK